MAPPMPMTNATPSITSQIGLVCLPAAGNAADGRRSASKNAQLSTTKAAKSSTQKNRFTTDSAVGLTMVTASRYLVSGGGGNWWIVPPGLASSAPGACHGPSASPTGLAASSSSHSSSSSSAPDALSSPA